MVRGQLKSINNSLKIRGCFFCLRNKVVLVVSFTLLFLSLTSLAFSGQVLEYSYVTGLWNLSAREMASVFFSRQVLEYSSVTGLWNYSTRNTASAFFSRQVIAQNPVTGLWY